jgi:hypothetical protein
VICTELLVVNANISAIQCGHLFHEECLSKWLGSGQKTCPQCRFTTSSKTIVKKLYLTESLDQTISSTYGEDPHMSDNQRKEVLMNKIEILKNDLRQANEALSAKSDLLEKVGILKIKN